MRTQQQPARRIQNNVMKSPSPDIANRNIIKDTKPPTDDIRKYLEKQHKSKSPRLSELTHSAQFRGQLSQVHILRERVRQLESIVKNLLSENQQYRRTLQQRAVAPGELNRMRDTIKSYDNSQMLTPKSDDRTNFTLVQMHDRMLKLSNENTRLGNLILEKQAYAKGIQIQLKKVNNELQYYRNTSQNSIKNNYNSQITSAPSSTQGYDISSIKNYYQNRIEPQLVRNQSQWMNRLRQISDRINKIQLNQAYIQRQVAKRNSLVTPMKKNGDKTPFSNKPTEQPNQNQANSGVLPQSIKPFQSISIKSANKQQPEYNKLLQDNIRQLQSKNRALQRQNQMSRRRTYELEDQLKRAKQLPKTVTDQSERKYRQLEQQIQNKKLQLNSIERDLRSTREDFNRLKQRSDRQIYLVENQRNTCKKAFQQEKQKTQELQDINYKLNQRCQILENRLKQKENGNEQLKQQIKSQYEYKQSSLKRFYQDQIKNKDKSIGEQLSQYLQLLNSIRRDIQSWNIDQVIGQSESAINQRLSIEKQIMYIRQQNQRIILEMKTRLIQQQQHIIQLEKDNQMMMTQIRQLQSQKQKLKKSMLQFELIKPVMTGTGFGTTNVNVTTSITSSTSKNEAGCKLKACLKQTLKKIDTLEHQITQILLE